MTELEYIERASRLRPSPEALNVIDDALAAFPASARLWTLRGDFLQYMEADHGLPLSEVDRSYRRAIAADPTLPDAYCRLGQFLNHVMAKPRKAKQYIHKAWLLRRTLATVDMNGTAVRIGSFIKIVGLEMDHFELWPPSEVEDVRSMIGEAFPVEMIVSDGFVNVTKLFVRGPGLVDSYSLCLSPRQIEIVD